MYSSDIQQTIALDSSTPASYPNLWPHLLFIYCSLFHLPLLCKRGFDSVDNGIIETGCCTVRIKRMKRAFTSWLTLKICSLLSVTCSLFLPSSLCFNPIVTFQTEMEVMEMTDIWPNNESLTVQVYSSPFWPMWAWLVAAVGINWSWGWIFFGCPLTNQHGHSRVCV